MTLHCNQCGTENRVGANFCTHCQSPLTQRAAISEMSAAVDRQFKFPVGSIIMGTICLIYLLNPTAGLLELIPDNIPGIGNLDEGLATVGMLAALNNMGLLNWLSGLRQGKDSQSSGTAIGD